MIIRFFVLCHEHLTNKLKTCRSARCVRVRERHIVDRANSTGSQIHERNGWSVREDPSRALRPFGPCRSSSPRPDFSHATSFVHLLVPVVIATQTQDELACSCNVSKQITRENTKNTSSPTQTVTTWYRETSDARRKPEQATWFRRPWFALTLTYFSLSRFRGGC